MASGSARSRAELVADVASTIDQASSERLADELFAVVSVLDRQPALRRALTEPAVPTANKQALLDALFGSQLGQHAMRVLRTAAEKRWSRGGDIGAALEEVAIIALASSAVSEGKLDDVEDELFRFGRIVESQPELREALSDAAVSVEGKRSLLSELLGRKVSKATRDLLDQIVVGRHGSVVRGIAHYQHVLAARHERLLATAWVATELDEARRSRITKALEH